MSSYPAPITGTLFDSPSGWTNSLGGPYTNGISGVRYLFYLRESGVSPNVVRTLTAWKSTDNGVTWAIVDNANSPIIGAARSGETCYNTFRDPTPATHKVWCSFPDTAGLINSGLAPTWRANFAFISFDMDIDTWGVKVGGGPQMYAQVGESSDSFVFQNTLLVYANGDVQAFYQGPPETVAAKTRDRAYTALYSGGVWGAGQVAFGAGESRDYAPCNLVAGDAGRVHLFATGSTNFVVAFGARKLYQNSMNAQVLVGQQLVSQDIIPGPSNGGGQFVSSAVTRDNGGATELLIGILRPATGNKNSFTAFPAICRADSADTPAWTQENANSTLAIASTEQFAGVPVLVSGTDVTVAWSGLDSVFPHPSYVYYSVNTGSGWGAATLLYTDPNGEKGSEELNGLGLNSWGIVFADSGAGELDYFEFPAPAETASVDCSITILGANPPGPTDYWNPGTSESLLCERNYPWITPPSDAKAVRLANSIPAPAVNVETELWSYTVPDGFWFTFDRMVFNAVIAGFVDGSGGLFFILDVNSPVGTPLPVARPIAKFTAGVGSLEEPFPVSPVQLYQGDTLRAKILVIDPLFGVGLPNTVTAIVEGWLFPHTRNV